MSGAFRSTVAMQRAFSSRSGLPSGARFVGREYALFRRELRQFNEYRRKAGEIAVRAEAYRLRGVLKKELKKGAPGGRSFSALRIISRGARNRKPLSKLSVAVRYWYAGKHGSNGKVFSVGFGGGKVVGMDGSVKRNNQLSLSWEKIAQVQQKGFTVPIGSAPRNRDRGKRRLMYVLGVMYWKKGKKRIAKYHFLKKETTAFTVPARPIIAPFWSAHQREAERNIASNFVKKMRGDRI